MKIIQLLAGAQHGGAETAFVDMCIAMKEAGKDVEVITRKNKMRVPRLQAAGITVHTLPFGGKLDFYTPIAMRRIIKKIKPDIVQSWMSRAAQKTVRWSPSMKIPQYLVVSRLGNKYKIKNFKKTDYFVTITPDIKTYLIDECGVDEKKITHINNFAETENIDTSIDRSTYNVPKNAPLLLSLGRLHDSKAFDTLINSMVNIPNAHLWIAGEGPERDHLKDLIVNLNLENRITLLGWRNDRAALFEAADICVFPSRYEPFGTVFVQAWANKMPLVTTNSDGPRQFVRHEEDGLITPIDDIDAMSATINRMIEDKALARKLAQKGLKRYQSEFTKEKTLRAYLKYFKEIRKSIK